MAVILSKEMKYKVKSSSISPCPLSRHADTG